MAQCPALKSHNTLAPDSHTAQYSILSFTGLTYKQQGHVNLDNLNTQKNKEKHEALLPSYIIPPQ